MTPCVLTGVLTGLGVIVAGMALAWMGNTRLGDDGTRRRAGPPNGIPPPPAPWRQTRGGKEALADARTSLDLCRAILDEVKECKSQAATAAAIERAVADERVRCALIADHIAETWRDPSDGTGQRDVVTDLLERVAACRRIATLIREGGAA